jgi:anti-anti-sigma factor
VTRPFHIRQHAHSSFTRNGYIIDARIAWWKVQTRSQAIVVTVCGELDASNTDRFARCVSELSRGGESFVVDLRAVTFLSVQCFRTLLGVETECRAGHTRWALVTDPQTRPLFEVIDPAGALPVTHSLTEAIRTVVPVKRSALQLVSSSKRRSKRPGR